MGLKFRRGTTAQKSGSLAFGEPYVNTDLGTLQIGGATGDITLGASGTGSAGQFSSISGSGLDITGNANIAGNLTLGGNITVGDQTTDTLQVIASLSSSLIPQTTNAFDLGSATKIWRDLYISTGSIKFIDGAGAVATILTANSLNTILSNTASVNTFTSSVNGYTASLETKNTTLATYTASLETKFSTLGLYTASLETKNSTLATYTASLETKNTTLATYTASLETKFTTLQNLTGSFETQGRGIISSSAQLNNTTITNLTVTNLTTVNETASVLFSSGSNTFGDFGNDTHSFTGSVQISGSFTVIGLSTATSYNGTINATNGVVSGSSQVVGILSSLNTYTGSNDTTNTAQNTRLTTLESVTGSYETKGRGIVSGSSQIAFSGVTGTVSNTQLANSTISGIALGSNLGTLTIGTGLSGTSYNGSTGVTIANTGVTSITTNTGLSTNASATGGVTITNTGVTSNVAGTGVTVSGATGAVTISIGQAVATSSNVQFNSLGVGMAASATAGRIDASGDIVAYSTSDKNFKENITPIENPIEKIRMISGNTYDWKADMKEFHGFEGNDVGVIAQEIEAVLPQLVTTRETGYKAVKYDKLVALLIEGIKAQQNQIDNLTIEIEKLKESKGL